MSGIDGDEARLRELAAWSVARGSLLFHLDLATALARESVAAAMPASVEPAVCVADVGPQGYTVAVLSRDLRRQVGQVTFANDGRPMFARLDADVAVETRAMATAAAAVRAAGIGDPAATVEAIALPRAAGTPASASRDVYLIARGDSPDDVVIGVHHRVEVSADGRTIAAVSPLSRAPLAIKGTTNHPPADVTVTHMLGDAPGEMHVYLSLRHGIPIDVITVGNEEHWQVNGEAISLFERS